jgi:hypothetical protein
MRKFIITKNVKEVQDLLDDGWKIVSMASQCVSFSSLPGDIAIYLEKIPKLSDTPVNG